MTAEDAADTDLGERIRRLRGAAGWSLNELARVADISPGTLSQIERGRASPSMRTLTKIRQALGLGIAAFFGDEAEAAPDTPPFVLRLARRHIRDLGPGRMIKQMVSPSTGGELSVFELVIPPGGGTGEETYAYPGEKAGLVLSGAVTLEVGGVSARLAAGDGFRFDAAVAHRLANPAADEARVIWVTSHRSI
jgi:transcriptional regulator with XRE-family HTH domain